MQTEQIKKVAAQLKTLSHPIRLKILCLLQEDEMTVGAIREVVETTDANVSQHLAILRNQGIIDFRKEANFIYNRISDSRVLELIELLRTIYCDND